MPRLFTYTMTFDTGAAPNPFFGICTLAICMPRIRRVAKPGDWVVGLGSKKSSLGDRSDCVIYAMCVEHVITMEEYDRYAPEKWPDKIPDCNSSDDRRKAGDCIYDFSTGEVPDLRQSVHDERERDNDLGGKNVLMSRDYYYFGRDAEELPDNLRQIRTTAKWHKSNCNAPKFDEFVTWIRSLEKTLGKPCSEAKCHQKCSSQPRNCQTKC